MTQIFDRQAGKLIQEQVFGDALVQGAYGARGLMSRVVARPRLQKLLSLAAGFGQDSFLSKRLIPGFVRDYAIPMAEFEVPAAGYGSFNEFFIRQFKAGQRSFPESPARLGSPAEGRLSVFPIASETLALNIKGTPLSLDKLVGSPVLAQPYIGGHAFVFRLCPVDYHRFHFPDDGRAGPSNRLGEELHSVNPLALQKVPDVFLRNERQVCLFESKNFGSLLLLEVGAICVGRIVQTYTPGKKVTRGQEKGYFAFGGSTTLMLTRKGHARPDEDLLRQTAAGYESLVRLGEPIASAGPVPA